MSASHLVSHYGYLSVLMLLFLEAMGVPFPGETILIAAGTYAGQTHHLNVWIIFLVAAAAASSGSCVGFWIGDKTGYHLLLKYGRYIHMKEKEIKVGRYVFDRHGAIVVSVGRFVALLRTYMAILAGTNRMRFHRFVVFSTAGAVAWTATWTFGSYYIGGSLQHASGKIDAIFGAAALVVVVAVILVIRKQSARLEAVAEAAYPGPLTP